MGQFGTTEKVEIGDSSLFHKNSDFWDVFQNHKKT